MNCAWIGLGIACSAIAAFGQTPAKPLAFAAASLKPSKEIGSHDKTTVGAMTERGQTLRNLIEVAYNVKEFQVVGGPKWVDADRYDVDGKASGPAEDPELSRMLQTLLAERFHLEVHHDSKPVDGYALVVIKGGIRAKRAEDVSKPSSQSHNGSLTAHAITMDHFAQFLARRTALPVVDATGLSDAFDFTMQWDTTTDRNGPAPNFDAPPTATDPKGQTLYQALQEQLGLRLESRKVPIDTIVVDRAEKPVMN